MTKFDLFNKATWNEPPSDIETKLRNKAIGWISSRLGELRKLRETILAKNGFTDEYHIAEDLRCSNPEAYRIMEVSIRYSDNKVNDVVKRIDEVFACWSDSGQRDNNWRHIANLLEPFKELFYPSNASYYNPFNLANEVEKFIKVEVNGNEAWKAYLKQAQEHKRWHGYYKEEKSKSDELKEKLSDLSQSDDDESDDDDDD